VEGSNKSPVAKWAVDQAGFVMGEPTPHATVAKILKFTLAGDIAEQISCPWEYGNRSAANTIDFA
jgi:hypothetical protein